MPGLFPWENNGLKGIEGEAGAEASRRKGRCDALGGFVSMAGNVSTEYDRKCLILSNEIDCCVEFFGIE